MRLAYPLTITITLLALWGCGNGDDTGRLAQLPEQRTDGRAEADTAAATRRLSDPADRGADERDDVLAMLGDTVVRWDDLRPIMIESAGATALSEWAMDRQIENALRERGIAVSEAEIEAEQQLLLDQFSDDPDDATRLLDRVREQRGLGPTRFRLLLKRNAALRKLVADRVQVTDGMVEQLHAQRFGPRTLARLILVQSVTEASRIKQRLADGEAFTDLAVELSIDESAARGGLLPEISPADATFPAAIRDAVADLEPGEVSDPIAVNGGFALLRVERQIPAEQDVPLEEVADELRREVRLRNERAAMQQRARMMLQDADLDVLDNQLQRAWRNQRRQLLDQP